MREGMAVVSQKGRKMTVFYPFLATNMIIQQINLP